MTPWEDRRPGRLVHVSGGPVKTDWWVFNSRLSVGKVPGTGWVGVVSGVRPFQGKTGIKEHLRLQGPPPDFKGASKGPYPLRQLHFRRLPQVLLLLPPSLKRGFVIPLRLLTLNQGLLLVFWVLGRPPLLLSVVLLLPWVLGERDTHKQERVDPVVLLEVRFLPPVVPVPRVRRMVRVRVPVGPVYPDRVQRLRLADQPPPRLHGLGLLRQESVLGHG